MITEKLMMPYVLASHHKVIHLAMTFTMIVVWCFQTKEHYKHYEGIKAKDLLK